MKKVLSIVLSLSMVLGSFGLAFAATPNVASKFSDVNGKNCEEAVKVLSDLNVVTGYDDGTYKPENIVTRAEMAVLVVNALGLQNYVTTNAKSTFKDMDNYGWAEGYIAYAQQLGIISGYGDGTFKPGKTVSYDEASTMLVAALGYTPASLQGTWPANYVTKAKSLGILDDVKAGPDGANRGDTAIMLYQTLDQKIGTVNKDNVWNENQGKQIADPFDDSKKMNAGDKMIYRLGADPDQTQIDTVVTGDEDSDINMRPYVGMCATKYYKDGKVIAVTDIQSTFIAGSFSGSNYEKFTADANDVEYTISLTGSDKANTYKTWNQVQTFFNGQPATQKQMEDAGFVYDKGAISGIQKDHDDIDATIAVKDNGKTIKTLYSISIWDHKVQGADAKVTDADVNSIKNDKSLLGDNFNTLKDGSIDLNSFELIGVASLDKIAKDNVVFVYTDRSSSPKITRVEVSQDTVSGQITEVKYAKDDKTNKDEAQKYTIDGKTYSFTNGLGSFTYEAGDTVKAYLDPKGKIYEIDDVSSTAGNYAVVIGTPLKVGFNYSVKLITKDGNETAYNFKDEDAFKETFKDKNHTGEDDATNFPKGTLVTYNLNSAGQITKLDNKTETGKPLDGKVNNGVVNGMQLADNAVVFTVSQDGTYDVISAKNIDKDTNVSTTGVSPASAGTYALNSGKIAAMIIDNRASGANNSYGFIDSVKGAFNKGQQVQKITAVIDGKKTDWLTDGDAVVDKAPAKNDLMRFEFNGDIITKVINVSANGTVLQYNGNSSDLIQKDQVLAVDSARWKEVTKKSDDILTYGVPTANAASPTTASISVKGAVAYQAVMDNNGSFDSWKVGNIGSIGRDYYVSLFQVNKNSSAPDVVVYVNSNDARNMTTFKAGGTVDKYQFDLSEHISKDQTPGGNHGGTAVFTNGKTTQEIDLGNGVTSSAVVAAKMDGSTAVKDTYTVNVTFKGNAANKTDITVTIGGTNVTVNSASGSNFITQTVDAGSAASANEFTVVSTSGVPVLSFSANSDVYYKIDKGVETDGALTKATVKTITGNASGTAYGTNAISKANNEITVTEITYTAPSDNGAVVFEIYNGSDLLGTSAKVDLAKGSGADGTVSVSFKMPAKDVTLTAKAVAVQEINAKFTESIYFGTFMKTNDLAATVTPGTVTGYAGEKKDVTVQVSNTSGTNGWVTVTLSGTGITTESQKIPVATGTNPSVTFHITVPSKDTSDLKLDVTGSATK